MPLVTDTKRLCRSRYGATVWHTVRKGKEGDAKTTSSCPWTHAGSPEQVISGGRTVPGSVGFIRLLVIAAAFSGLWDQSVTS